MLSRILIVLGLDLLKDRIGLRPPEGLMVEHQHETLSQPSGFYENKSRETSTKPTNCVPLTVKLFYC